MKKWLYFLAIIAVIAIILITVILLKPWQKSEAGPDSGAVPGTAPIDMAENNFNESARATPDALANIEEIRLKNGFAILLNIAPAMMATALTGHLKTSSARLSCGSLLQWEN